MKAGATGRSPGMMVVILEVNVGLMNDQDLEGYRAGAKR
jgi:hypothetical protein